MGLSGHLLRTLAAVAPGARVACLGPVGADHAESLARLGFDVSVSDEGTGAVHARLADAPGEAGEVRRTPVPSRSGSSDGSADWVVLAPASPGALRKAARVLRPGGWVWTESDREDGLAEAAAAAGLVPAEAPAPDAQRGTVHAVFRRPGAVG